MFHTAPAREKVQLRKAIEELKKKELTMKKIQPVPEENMEKRKFYKILGQYGVDSDITEHSKDYVPDMWWSHEVSKWASNGTKTFIYIPKSDISPGDILLMNDLPAVHYTHDQLAKDSREDREITSGDFNGVFRKANLYELLTDEEKIDKNLFIHGRTGPIPLRGEPDDVEFVVSIWNFHVNRNDLDDMMFAINKKLYDFNYGHLLVPEHI